MRYKAVLFDMDGTVLDTLGDLANAINHILSEYHMPTRTLSQVAHSLGNGAAHLVRTSVPAGTPEALCAEMLAVYQPWYDSHCAILTAPYPGIPALMEALKAAGRQFAFFDNWVQLRDLSRPGGLAYSYFRRAARWRATSAPTVC